MLYYILYIYIIYIHIKSKGSIFRTSTATFTTAFDQLFPKVDEARRSHPLRDDV